MLQPYRERLIGLGFTLLLCGALAYAFDLTRLMMLAAVLLLLGVALWFLLDKSRLVQQVFMPARLRDALAANKTPSLEVQQRDHQDHQNTGGMDHAPWSIALLADSIKTPENIGSLFRLADAYALEHLYLCGTSPSPPNPRIRKTARATEQTVAYSCHDQAVDLLQQLKQQGYRIVCLEHTNTSDDLSRFSLPAGTKLVLVLGSEKQGVSDACLAQAEQCVHIPMLGQNSSMNVAMAAAIAVHSLSQMISSR